MTSFEIPVPELLEGTFVEKTTRGPAGSQSTELLPSMVSVGRPIAIPLSDKSASEDKELASFLAAEANVARYHLVHLACTFEDSDLARIAKARLIVRLTDAS